MLLQPDGVAHGVQGKRVLRSPFGAEKVDRRAHGDHEVVVSDGLHPLDRHASGAEIDVRHGGSMERPRRVPV